MWRLYQMRLVYIVPPRLVRLYMHRPNLYLHLASPIHTPSLATGHLQSLKPIWKHSFADIASFASFRPAGQPRTPLTSLHPPRVGWSRNEHIPARFILYGRRLFHSQPLSKLAPTITSEAHRQGSAWAGQIINSSVSHVVRYQPGTSNNRNDFTSDYTSL